MNKFSLELIAAGDKPKSIIEVITNVQHIPAEKLLADFEKAKQMSEQQIIVLNADIAAVKKLIE